jgi:hypothetical protein
MIFLVNVNFQKGNDVPRGAPAAGLPLNQETGRDRNVNNISCFAGSLWKVSQEKSNPIQITLKSESAVSPVEFQSNKICLLCGKWGKKILLNFFRPDTQVKFGQG